METYLPASSPIYGLTTCAACPGVQYFDNGVGGYSVLFSGGSMSLNFTAITLVYTINGTAVSPLSSPASDLGRPISLTEFELPYGRHAFTVDIARPSDGSVVESDTFLYHGATIKSGFIATANSSERTIDDTAWRSGEIALSEGWNMLETPFEDSNYIDTDLVQTEAETLTNDAGASISFTQRAGVAMSITFQGQAVWAYGISGGEAGTYRVEHDDGPVETFDGSGGPRAHGSLLYYATGLSNRTHTLTFTNLEDGKRFSFDRLVVASGLMIDSTTPTPTPNPSATSSIQQHALETDDPAQGIPFPSPSSAPQASATITVRPDPAMPDQDRSNLSVPAIAGVAVALTGVAVVLGFLAWWLYGRYARRAGQDQAKRNTFFQFASGGHTDKGDRRNFTRISSPMEARDDVEPKHSAMAAAAFRFPGLGLPITKSKSQNKGQIKRKESFLDLSVEAEQGQGQGQSSERPISERRIVPINYETMAGESPLTELVRYSPHDPSDPIYETFGRHRVNGVPSIASGMTGGTGWILPQHTQAPTVYTRPTGPGGAL